MNEATFTLTFDDQQPLALRISPATQREKKQLMDLVSSIVDPTTIVVDLREAPLNSSVLDEILCRDFLRRLRDPDEPAAYAVLVALHPHTQEELRLGARASGKSNVVFVARTADGPQLVGMPTKEVENTFDALNTAGHMTARELADREGVSINVAHNRLRLLHELRLAFKEGPEAARGGGRQHIYRPVS
jgi:hypothetical protein